MGRLRFLAAAGLLALLSAGAVWVAGLAPHGTTAAAPHFVAVVGPGGAIMANGTIEAEPATPLGALQALGFARGFDVEVEESAGFGGCSRHYVVGIAQQRETASGGWNFYVREPSGAWEWQPAGAACVELDAGDEVEWCWVEGDVCERHWGE
jgi:hypothetical protein